MVGYSCIRVSQLEVKWGFHNLKQWCNSTFQVLLKAIAIKSNKQKDEQVI